MSNLRNRIIGTETEFGLIMPGGSGVYSEQLQKSLPKHLVMVHEFLSNGGRFYNDYNNQLEYATPECYGVVDAVHAEIAGEAIAYETLEKLRSEESIEGFRLFKRVIDDTTTTWGYHENYLVNRETYDTWIFRTLLLGHLATRNIFVGAGWLDPHESDITRVVPGQKSQTVAVDASGNTTHDKPLLNLRDEPHALSNEWARLHITSGDPNISPWATWLKLGSTSLVIRLAEQEAVSASMPRLAHPAVTSHMVGMDAELRNLYGMSDGSKMSAVNIQEWFVEQCERIAEQIDLPKEERHILKAWREAIDDIQIDPERLVFRADWITRRQMLGGIALRHNIQDNDDTTILSNADQAWDMIHPKAGVGIRHRHKMAFPGYSPERAARLILHPPENTRAAARAKIIHGMPRAHRERAEVDWEQVAYGNKEFYMFNPYLGVSQS